MRSHQWKDAEAKRAARNSKLRFVEEMYAL